MKKEKKIPALLLAGGLGTRLKPLTNTIPKCLVPILGRPLLDIWIEQCLSFNMNPIIINLSYLSEKVEEYLFSSPLYLQNKEKFLLLYEKELKGTAGTLLSQEELLQDSSFFVAHADNLSFFSMTDFYNAHKNRPENTILTAMTFYTDNPESCGIFEANNLGIAEKFHEKVKNPPSNLANGAVYFMESDIFSILKEHGKVDKKTQPDISLDLLPHCLGKIFLFHNNTYHKDIGTPENYTQAQNDALVFLKKEETS